MKNEDITEKNIKIACLDNKLKRILIKTIDTYKKHKENDMVCWYEIIANVSKIIFENDIFMLDEEEGAITVLLEQIREEWDI